ncbi:GNAT family N-acetyltransferase [Merismopedia glauca]|uniref:GNAT family N-acetyltransferase n=1 Tax=Merismopedia glauca CCAP 1448/3 TaxID=1296344 RepID=A0A2T1CA57_9CYAN|nr:GNAT family N-acetyltransferase [Merismopedia glauca]PSB05124.1 GNAT family N-acetyltransferase [Merismopedia glauca CCAP 1448/3]
MLSSSRLAFRPCTDADIDLLLQHWTEPMVRRYLFDDRIIDRETVAGFIELSSTLFQNKGYGLWVLTNKANGEFQGVCGLWDGEVVSPDLLYSISTSAWGQGLATESARCVLEYAFEQLKLPYVMSTVDLPNTASIRVLEKNGMKLHEERSLNGNPIRCYSLNAEDYKGLCSSDSLLQRR